MSKEKENLATTPVAKVTEGAFFLSLSRKNNKIKEDRAEAIAAAAEKTFRREVEDIGDAMEDLKRDRENMLDMSPDNTMSIIVASDFNAKEYVDKEIEIGIKLRNLGIKYDMAKDRYAALFGKDI